MNAAAEERHAATQAVFEALSHPVRRQILMTVHFRGGTMSAGEIADRFGHTWATTTGHLNALVSAGLLSRIADGRRRLYTIDRARLGLAESWLAWFSGEATAQVEAVMAGADGAAAAGASAPPRRGRGAA